MSNIRELSQLASVIVVDNNTKNVGIGSTLPGSKLSVGGDVYVSGNTRIVGILSVGSGTVTIDGDNGVIGVGTVTLTESQVSQLDDLTGDDGNFSGSVSVAGSITAATLYGNGSNLTGISIDAISNIVEDTTPQLGGNLDLNGSNITGTGNIDITGNVDVNGNLNVDGVLTYQDVTNVDSIGIVTARKGITVESGYGINVVSGVVTATTFEGNVTGTASNSSQLDSQLPSYYLNYNNFTNTPTIPTNNNQLTNGAGYITSADGGNAATLDSQLPSYYLNYNNLTNTPTIPTNNNELTNGAGYITGITGESLGNLSDVSTSGATNGQVLAYNGTSWAPSSAGGSNADTLDSQLPSYYLDYNNFTNTPTIPTNNNQLTNGAGYITSADNAATADSSPLLSSLGNYVWSASSLPTSFNQGIECSFVRGSDGWQNYGSIMNMRTYSGGGGSLQLYVPYSPTYGGNSLQVRFGNYDSASGNSWTSWKTLWDSGNDGSGSGLDADLLDGIDSTQFLRSDAAATASGAITLSVDTTDALNFSANTTDDNRGIAFNARTALSADYNDGWLRINNTSEFTNGVYTPGNFRVDGVMRVDSTRGITDVTGQYGTIQTNGSGVGNWEGYSIDGRAVFMHDGGTGTGLYNDVNNHWILYAVHNAAADLRYAGSAKITTTSTGVSVSGDVNSTSDIKLKKNIETIDNALDKVLKLHGVYFDWKEEEIGNSRNIGFIAQEVEEVLPEVVTEIQREVRDGKGVDSKVIETESIKNVSYGNITALLVEAMKEQQKQIEALNERIRVLEGQ